MEQLVIVLCETSDNSSDLGFGLDPPDRQIFQALISSDLLFRGQLSIGILGEDFQELKLHQGVVWSTWITTKQLSFEG